MNTIARYLTREVAVTMTAVTLILLFIFMCNNLVRYLGMVARGKYAFWVLIHLVLLQIPITLGLLLPLGLYIGVLLAYGRLYVDSEMTVLFACGFSRRQLLAANMSLAFVVMLVTAFFSCFLQPALNLRIHQVLAEAQSGSVIETLMPGRFQSVSEGGGGERVYYVKKVSRGHKHVQEVFSADRKGGKDSHWEIIVASKGEDKYMPQTNSDYFQMTDGAIYKGVPGQKNFQVINYKTYGLRVDQDPLKGFTVDPNLMSMSQLIVASKFQLKALSELEWRLSVPIAVLLLSFLALPLSRIRPRQGRYAKFLPAILIFIVYFNFLMLARGWITSGLLPPWVGLWGVHCVVFLFALLLYRSKGSWQIWKKVVI